MIQLALRLISTLCDSVLFSCLFYIIFTFYVSLSQILTLCLQYHLCVTLKWHFRVKMLVYFSDMDDEYRKIKTDSCFSNEKPQKRVFSIKTFINKKNSIGNIKWERDTVPHFLSFVWHHGGMPNLLKHLKLTTY